MEEDVTTRTKLILQFFEEIEECLHVKLFLQRLEEFHLHESALQEGEFLLTTMTAKPL
jgi:hypothetical protein